VLPGAQALWLADATKPIPAYLDARIGWKLLLPLDVSDSATTSSRI